MLIIYFGVGHKRHHPVSTDTLQEGLRPSYFLSMCHSGTFYCRTVKDNLSSNASRPREERSPRPVTGLTVANANCQLSAEPLLFGTNGLMTPMLSRLLEAVPVEDTDAKVDWPVCSQLKRLIGAAERQETDKDDSSCYSEPRRRLTNITSGDWMATEMSKY